MNSYTKESVMPLPGFNADAALYRSSRSYRATTSRSAAPTGGLRVAEYRAIQSEKTGILPPHGASHCTTGHDEFCEGICYAVGGGMTSDMYGGTSCYW
jgi:hypothetical protein